VWLIYFFSILEKLAYSKLKQWKFGSMVIIYHDGGGGGGGGEK